METKDKNLPFLKEEETFPLNARLEIKKITLLLGFFLSFSLSTLIFSEAGENLTLKGARLLELKQYRAAKVTLERALILDKQAAEIHYYLGQTYLMLGDYDKAVEHAEQAVKLKETEADYHFWLGRAYGEKAKYSSVFKQAWLAPKIRKEFEKTLKLDPRHIPGLIGLGNFYLQAPSFMGGSIEQAARQAKILIALNELEGKLLGARIQEKKENFALAEAVYKELEKKYGDSPDSDPLYNNYGEFLLRQKRYQEAIKKFKKQVDLFPDKTDSHAALGNAYKAAGELSAAEKEYRKAGDFR